MRARIAESPRLAEDLALGLGLAVSYGVTDEHSFELRSRYKKFLRQRVDDLLPLGRWHGRLCRISRQSLGRGSVLCVARRRRSRWTSGNGLGCMSVAEYSRSVVR